MEKIKLIIFDLDGVLVDFEKGYEKPKQEPVRNDDLPF